MQAGVEVGYVQQALSIHEDIRRVSDARSVGTGVDPRFDVSRWDVVAHLLRPHRIPRIEDSHACILIGGKHQIRALEGAGSVFVQVVWAEMAAEVAVVLLGWRRKRRDGHGVGLVAY